MGDLCYLNEVIYAVEPHFSGKNWVLILRPERLFPITKTTTLKNTTTFEGKILDFVFQGETTLGMIQVMNGDILTIRTSSTTASTPTEFKAGEGITVGIKNQDRILIQADSVP